MKKVHLCARPRKGFIGPGTERLVALNQTLTSLGYKVSAFESPVFVNENNKVNFSSTKASSLKNKVRKIKKFIPLFLTGSLKEALQASADIVKNKPDVIVISIPPFLLAIFGVISAKFFTNSKVILDFRDIPFTTNYNDFFLTKKVDYLIFKLMKPFVDEVWSVSEFNVQELNKFFGSSAIHMRNGISISTIEKINELVSERNNNEVSSVSNQHAVHYLLYAGALDSKQRDLKIVIDEIFNADLTVELWFASKSTEVVEELLKYAKIKNVIVKYLGVVSRDEVLFLQVHSYANVIIEPSENKDSAGNVPSKIFELMCSLRPVILFGGESNSEMLKILTRFPSLHHNYIPSEYNFNEVEAFKLNDLYIRESIFTLGLQSSILRK